jgi:hypothetical protein
VRSAWPAAVTRLALVGLIIGAVAGTPSTSAASSTWTGGIDLYRSGVFTTQKSWLWCTAASIQIIGNVVRDEADHSRASQSRYFDFMRAHNRYRIPVKNGVDPAGWTAGLREFVDDRYRLVASSSFDAALRSAVTNLRMTELPVGITVAHGDHAWVMTGFTATADPATTTDFRVTSVRVVGPLFGLKTRTYGYDMAPDKKLTPRQFDDFFTPWHYDGVHMAWEDRWVSVQPVAAETTPDASAPAAVPSPAASAAASPFATASPAPSGTALALADARRPSPPSAAAPVASIGAPPLVVLIVAVAVALGVFALGLRAGPHRVRHDGTGGSADPAR